MILDWESARAGEAEEDLGNLIAHVAWESTEAAPEAARAFLGGYASAGGAWDARLLVACARASMVRVRAVHGWRDGWNERARDTALWRLWKRTILSW